MLGAGVEQRRRTGHVVVRCDQVIELDRLMRCSGESAGNAQEKVLRSLDHLSAERVAQQVSVIDGAKAEVLETIGEVFVDCMVEFTGVNPDEFCRCG